MMLRQYFSSLGLGQKLALACAGVELILLSLLLGGVLVISMMQIERHENLREKEVRFLLTRSLADSLVRQDASELLDIVDRISINPEIIYLQVTDLRGRVLARRGTPTDTPFIEDIEVGGQRYGQVSFALSTQHLEVEQRILFTSLMAGGLLVIVLSVIVFFAIGQILTMRLRMLSSCARNLSEGNYSVCVNPEGSDEVAQLGQAFAKMQDAVRLRIEELEQARSAAEEASRAKSYFLANISHELRTPLNAITGFTSLALRTPNSPKQQAQLQKALDGAHQLSDVITDILDITRLESGQVHVESRPFHVEDFEGKLLTLIGAAASDKSVEFVTDIPIEVYALTVIGDPSVLERVLLILLDNALKFTQAGSITLSIHTVMRTDDKCTIRFEVSDTGIGIAAENHQRIFNLFEQVDNSTTRGYGGLGLGLHIAQLLVAKMGGDLHVSSAIGEGSTFWFELPFELVPS